MDIERIRRIGRFQQRFILIVILLTPVVILIILTLKGPIGLIKLPPGIEIDPMKITFPGSLLVVSVGLLTPITYTIGFAFIYQLFRSYAQGIVFSQKNILVMRRIGYVLMAVDVVRILQSALTGPVLTMVGAVEGYLAIDIGFSMLVVGMFIVSISRVMEIGLEIYERDRLTI